MAYVLEVKYDKESYEKEIERLKSDFRIDNQEIYGVGGFQEPYTVVALETIKKNGLKRQNI